MVCTSCGFPSGCSALQVSILRELVEVCWGLRRPSYPPPLPWENKKHHGQTGYLQRRVGAADGSRDMEQISQQ